MQIILGAGSMLNLMTQVDATYAVYGDVRSHKGGAMSFGTGVIMCKSDRQKLNTNILTKLEVVGASNYIPGVVWEEILLKYQGVILETIIFVKVTKAL